MINHDNSNKTLFEFQRLLGKAAAEKIFTKFPNSFPKKRNLFPALIRPEDLFCRNEGTNHFVKIYPTPSVRTECRLRVCGVVPAETALGRGREVPFVKTEDSRKTLWPRGEMRKPLPPEFAGRECFSFEEDPEAKCRAPGKKSDLISSA